MTSKLVSNLVAVVLVLTILVVAGESGNAGNVTADASEGRGRAPPAFECQEYKEKCKIGDEDLQCCEDLECTEKKHGKGVCLYPCRNYDLICTEVVPCCKGLYCDFRDSSNGIFGWCRWRD